jgi:transcriptional regulator with XRE-family HTH domain
MPNIMAFKNPPAEVVARIQQLAERIRIARKRRGWTIVETAAKAGVNRNTLTALELAKPGISVSAYIAVLWVLGLDRTLDAVADPDEDTHGKILEAARRPERTRKRQAPKNEYDF